MLKKADKNSKSTVIAVFVYIILIALLIVLYCSMHNRQLYQNAVELVEGWTLSIDGKEPVEIDNLNDFSFPPSKKGEHYSFVSTLPEFQMTAPTMRIWVCLSSVEVWIDGERIFEYGGELLKQDKLLGSGIHWVSLPAHSAGKEIKIEITCGDNDTFTYLTPPILDEGENAFKDFLAERTIILCIAFFLIVFAICVLMLGIILVVKNKMFVQVIYTGVFSLLLGMWLFCNKGFILIMSDNLVLNILLEYFSFYLCPIPIILFIINERKNTVAKKFYMPLYYFLGVFITLITTIFVLQITNVAHVNRFLKLFHVIVACILVYLLTTSNHMVIKEKHSGEKYIWNGTIILTISFTIDIMLFNIGKYVNSYFDRFTGVSGFGTIFFIQCMLLSFGSTFIEKNVEENKQKLLVKLAYRDALTKLGNRCLFEKELEKSVSEGRTFTVINFDVNNLKKINDNKGHAMGDELLTRFADALVEAFGVKGVACRTGGDEFYVLLKDILPDEVKQLIARYQEILKNKSTSDLEISAAWGVARSDEKENFAIRDILKLADDRMYENKKQMKKV